MGEIPRRLLVCVTFHYVPSRLRYLTTIAAEFSSLAESTKVVIITNDLSAHESITSALSPLRLDLEILTPTLLGHPYLLTWCHKDIFRREHERKSNEYSHYLYTEDDLLIREHNIDYWMESRERLKPSGLIPSFVRYEINPDSQLEVSVDQIAKVDPAKAAKIFFPHLNYAYIALPNPHQGTYLFDRDLLAEHFESIHRYGPDAPAPDGWIWTIEKSALGASFCKVPYGFSSRNVVGYQIDAQSMDMRCLIHHTPNNYTINPNSKFGDLPICGLISPPICLPRRRRKRHIQRDGSLLQLPRQSPEEYLKSVFKRLP
jgi:hypothetical protein